MKFIKESHQETTVLAYLDDVYIIGPVDFVLSALTDFKYSLSSIGLNICDKNVSKFAQQDLVTSLPRFQLLQKVLVFLEHRLGPQSLFRPSVFMLLREVMDSVKN